MLIKGGGVCGVCMGVFLLELGASVCRGVWGGVCTCVGGVGFS